MSQMKLCTYNLEWLTSFFGADARIKLSRTVEPIHGESLDD